MLVRDRMTSVLFTARPETSVADVEHVMRHRRIRHVPVVSDDGRLVGIVTDRDVRTAMPSPATSLAAGEIYYLVNRLRVERIMTHAVIAIGPDAPISDAVGRMLARRIGALPVLEGGRLVGIITETDLLRAFAEMCASGATTPSGGSPEAAWSPERAAADAREAVPPACPAAVSTGHSILVPLDGSPGSESVLPTVAELALARSARVRLLRVVAVPAEVRIGDRIVAYADQEAGRVELETLYYLKGIADALPGVEVARVVRFGDPVDEIVREAQTAGVDLIAMATHRRTALDRAFNGSIAETVERAAAIPVVLVPYGSALS
jgi:acetoin utilization protein AcuB